MQMFNNVSQSTGHDQAIACPQHNETTLQSTLKLRLRTSI